MSKRIAIIPARGGSKRIPGKNIKRFLGSPLISYSISAALKSHLFDRVIVSTDDHEIKKVAVDCGAEVPFIRPPEISDDHAATLDVMKHALEWVEKNDTEKYSTACCIYATAPFLDPLDLAKGVKALENNNDDYCFSATTFPYPIQRALRLSIEGKVAMFYPENYQVRSQDLEEAYHDAGQFYWGKVNAFIEKKPVFFTKSSAVVLPRFKVQDIDTLEDWKNAELLFELLRQKSENLSF